MSGLQVKPTVGRWAAIKTWKCHFKANKIQNQVFVAEQVLLG
jgi:hypothetical protein